MTTPAQIESNRGNAAQSTGPKTPTGKARASKNALRHGLRSDLPILPGEQAEDWQTHRDGIVESLAPSGGLETVLVERVPLCLWRLRRVTAYETAVTALGIEEAPEEIRRQAADPQAQVCGGDEVKLPHRLAKAERELREARESVAPRPGADRLLQELPRLSADAPVEGGDVWDTLNALLDTASGYRDRGLPDADDDKFLMGLGVPEDELPDAYEWGGWTAGMVRQAWEQIAQAAKVKPDKLLARTVQDRLEVGADNRRYLQGLEKKVKDLNKQVKDWRQVLRTREARLRQRRLLPDDNTLNKITRYEAHLSRQLLQALHTLERLQAARVGQAVPPPAALDVTVDAAGTAPGAGSVAGLLEESAGV